MNGEEKRGHSSFLNKKRCQEPIPDLMVAIKAGTA